MDLEGIINQLLEERERLNELIHTFELMQQRKSGRVKSKRGRKEMNDADRQEVSLRMRRYWANRKKAAEGGSSEEPPPLTMHAGGGIAA